MKFNILTIIFLFLIGNVFGDGVIVPATEDYPALILKNKVTKIDVEINGLIATTTVYQEFENESTDTVDGVFSFPLPANARAIRLQYSIGDTLVDAILKVQQQSTTPGTGTGGEIASLNRYMGLNVIKLSLKRIRPNSPKSVQLTYISTLKQFHGKYEYLFPHNTADFVKHPLDFFQFHIKVYSSKSLQDFELSSHPGFQIIENSPNNIEVVFAESKSYAAKDIDFNYSVYNSPFDVELFAWETDSTDGYFSLVGKPQVESADSTLDQNFLFLLCSSTSMLGNKFNQSKIAISLALDELSENDFFNIMEFNSYYSLWKTESVPATLQNISEAKEFLAGLTLSSGNRLDISLRYALNLYADSDKLSSIIVFNDGRSPIDPVEIEETNKNKTGIFFVAIGNNIDRVKLEAVAAGNYGFVAYVREDYVSATDIFNVINKIKSPILKDINYSFIDPLVYEIYPAKFPAIFAGTDFLISGRYKISGSSEIIIQGENLWGLNEISFQRDFLKNNELARFLWAKSAIDKLEADILIYGEEDSLKNRLIELSLNHNIRCRYTAYVEDAAYVDPGWDPDDKELSSRPNILHSELKCIYNYPNPFSTYTVLSILIKNTPKSLRVLEFYDIHGRLIKKIDVSDFQKGVFEIPLSRSDFGNVQGGMIYVRYMEGNQVLGKTIMLMVN